jgi:ribosomal protein S18 acetylase RimI-like enzyme
LQLQPFTSAAAAQISSWATSRDEVFAWCSHTEAPVPEAVIVAWSEPPDVDAYVLVDDAGELVAYGELWIDNDEREVELARLIVAPQRRSRGIGRRLVAMLTDEARRHHRFVALRVHPDNEPARRCYAAAGFERATAEKESEWNRGQPIGFVWMLRRPR